MIWVCHMSLFLNKLMNKSLPVNITILSRDSSKIVFLIKAKRSLFQLICRSGLQFGVLPSLMCHGSPCLIIFLEYYYSVHDCEIVSWQLEKAYLSQIQFWGRGVMELPLILALQWPMDYNIFPHHLSSELNVSEKQSVTMFLNQISFQSSHFFFLSVK